MTKDEAQDKLDQACQLIFQVEDQMDITKSHVRRLGYNARIAIQSFKNAIRQSERNTNLKDL